ncbi:uncharacterized [Tachysurus ichikawai]
MDKRKEVDWHLDRPIRSYGVKKRFDGVNQWDVIRAGPFCGFRTESVRHNSLKTQQRIGEKDQSCWGSDMDSY